MFVTRRYRMFGHLGFGPANLGQNHFWPMHFWPIHLDLGVCVCVSWRGMKGGTQTQRKSGRGPEGWDTEAQNFAFFSSPARIFALFVSLWVSSRGILVVFEAPERSYVRVWSSLVVV